MALFFFKKNVFAVTKKVIYITQVLKGNAQFVQKVTFESFMDFKQNY